MGKSRTFVTLLAACFASLIPIASHATEPIGASPIPPRTIAPPPAPVFDVRAYGATGNGTTYDTAAIQQAINACAGTGGSVLLSGGSFVSAALELKGNMTFYIAEDATLLGGLEAADYPEILPFAVDVSLSAIWNKRSLIYANEADGLKLDGGGTIDGRGAQVNIFGTGGFMAANAGNRPSILRIFQSDDVIVRNLDIRNPRMWTLVFDRCQRLLIEHLDVNAPAYYPNLDGMDIVDSSEVIIRNNIIESEDDSICLKSHSLVGLDDILISNNFITCHNANAIKIGTATLGPITNIRIEHNTIRGVNLGGVCIESVDGSLMDGVHVDGIDMHDVGQPIFVRLGHRPDWRTATLSHRTGPGEIKNVIIENVRITGTHDRTSASNTVTGIQGARLENIILRDIEVEMPGGLATIPAPPVVGDGVYPQSNIFGRPPGYAFYVRHADGVRFENITTRSVNQDARPWLVALDASVEALGITDLRHTHATSNLTLDPHATLEGLPEVFGFRAGNTHGQSFQIAAAPVLLEKIRIGYGALSGTATATTFTLSIDAGNNGSAEISKSFTLAPADIVRLASAPYGGIQWLDLDVSEFALELPVGTHSFLLTATSVTGPANSWLLAPAYTNGGGYSGGAMLGTAATADRDANFTIVGSSVLLPATASTGFSNSTGWTSAGGTSLQSTSELLAGSGQHASIDMAAFENGVILSHSNPSSTLYCSVDFRIDGTFGNGSALANFNSGGNATTSSNSATHCIVRLYEADGSIQAFNGSTFLNVVPPGGIVSGVTYTVQIDHNIPGQTYDVRVYNRSTGTLIGSISGVPTRSTASSLLDPLHFAVGTQAASTSWDLAVDNMSVSSAPTVVPLNPGLRILSANFNPAGQFVIHFTGAPSKSHEVTRSTDLLTFTPLETPLMATTGEDGSGQVIVPVTELSGSAAFFRVEER
ncbi:MAG: glycosyl hydrolase family 28 protein [Akkermansiaceae bacterium]|jgi:polygalacturonase|nr:glycosyl hydrolase family 28 protein [Akkermansiaceae bacterium]